MPLGVAPVSFPFLPFSVVGRLVDRPLQAHMENEDPGGSVCRYLLQSTEVDARSHPIAVILLRGNSRPLPLLYVSIPLHVLDALDPVN